MQCEICENIENRGDDTQVRELLDKVEEMVPGNRGGYYEMDREILEKMEERRRAEQERAQQMLMKVQEQRETLRSLMVSLFQCPPRRGDKEVICSNEHHPALALLSQ